jgi:aminocarboxymuconate-semialdehyde decarboxylase
MKVVDVHTHLLNDAYLARLKRHGGGYKVRKVLGGQTGIVKDGAPFMTLMPGMFDYELRIRAMDEAGVDIAIVTLTSPNVFWGSSRQSLEAARAVNDDMAAQSRRFPERIRFMCSLPWQHPKLALTELRRACDELGAVGVMQLANVDGASLTDACRRVAGHSARCRSGRQRHAHLQAARSLGITSREKSWSERVACSGARSPKEKMQSR